MRTIAVVLALSMVLLSTVALSDEADLVWSTFLGGSGLEYGMSISVDYSGSAYMTGWTMSNNFPTTAGAFDTTHNGAWDVFVAKLDPTGSALNYSTFLGGSSDDWGFGIAIDNSGNAYVTGHTISVDFPATSGTFDTTHNGEWDVFVTKINRTGSDLEYSTFLGGGGEEWAYGIAIGRFGSAHVTGYTESGDFPTTAGAFDTTHNGEWDVFVAKLDPTGSALSYSTFLGGSESEAGYGIIVDDLGSAYVSVMTGSADFPTTPGAFDNSHNGSADALVAKLNPTGSALDYATFLGGDDIDNGGTIIVDNDDQAYVSGYTRSADFPTTAGAFDTTYNGEKDAFVAKLNPTGNSLDFATFLGGDDDDHGKEIALDNAGNAYVTGWTESSDFPTTTGAFDTTHNGGKDVFVAKLYQLGSDLSYSTFLGSGSGESIAVDSAGNAYVTGSTGSADFPTTAGAFDQTLNGRDAFVAKLNLSGTPVPVVLASFEATGGQGFIALNWVTASEINCHRWEIYRSEQEVGVYSKIGELLGYGSTETAHTYRWVDRQVRAGVTYFYKLKQLDFDGSSWWSHGVSATAGLTVPKAYALHQNYPNPFNPDTWISYRLPEPIPVTIKIYNVNGQLVNTLVDEEQAPGTYRVRWSGRDLHGTPVASGVYFCRLRAGNFDKAIKMVLVK